MDDEIMKNHKNITFAIAAVLSFFFLFWFISYTNNDPMISQGAALPCRLSDFTVDSGNDKVQISSESVVFKGEGLKLIARPVDISNINTLYVKCDLKTASEIPAVLYIDLYGQNYDTKEAELKITLLNGATQSFAGLIHTGVKHPDQCLLRIFCLDDTETEISNFSLCLAEEHSRRKYNILIAAFFAVMIGAIFRSDKAGQEKAALAAVLLFVVISSGAVLHFLNSKPRNIIGDEAVYTSQAYSIAYDMDNRFDGQDLERFYIKINPSGPRGIFLNEKNGAFYMSKPILYSLAGSVFVRSLGRNGLSILNLNLVYLLIGLGYCYLSKWNSKLLSIAFSLFFFGATVIWAYVFETFTDIFNTFLLAAGLFSFLQISEGEKLRTDRLLLSAVIWGAAVYQRAPYAVFEFFCVLYLMVKKGIKPKAAAILFGGISVAVFFIFTAVHLREIGTLSPYIGKRYYFDGIYPGVGDVTERLLEKMKINSGTETSYEKMCFAITDIKAFLLNWFYFFFGSQTGVLIYFPGLALILLNVTRRSLKKNWFILAGIVAHSIFWMLRGYDNFYGGAQAVGNRYFLQIYSAVLLLINTISMKRTVIGGVLAAFVFRIFLWSPPEKMLEHVVEFRNRDIMEPLPIELTQLRNRVVVEGPSTVVYFGEDGRPRQKAFSELKLDYIWLGFLRDYRVIDDYETYGHWTRGDHTETLYVCSGRPLQEIEFYLSSDKSGILANVNNKQEINVPAGEKVQVLLVPDFADYLYGFYYYTFSVQSEGVTEKSDEKDTVKNPGVYISDYRLIYDQ